MVVIYNDDNDDADCGGVVVMKTLAATTIVMMMDGLCVKSNCGFVYMITLIKSEKKKRRDFSILKFQGSKFY